MTLRLEANYARLPERFFARVSPTKVREPHLIRVNEDLARRLGLDPSELSSEEAVQLFAGNRVPEGAEPIALAYAGHQFGQFVSQLGDGRAILLGEVRAPDGTLWDVQLKGAGRTPFSRGGDGRAALGPVLREYLVSEAMARLGIPTTRSLAAVGTGELVARDVYLPGAILTRVASSHLRVGTFEFFAARGDKDALVALVSYALDRHYPDAKGRGNDALALLERVIEAHAELVARWLGVGFIHGVMNTDNTSISGETLDYGPCAFLDAYDPAKVFSSIDRSGRYAFGQQPRMALWNLARLGEALLPLIDEREDEAVRQATARLDAFSSHFERAYATVLRRKLGLEREEREDVVLASDLLERLAANKADFTVFFRHLCRSLTDPEADEAVASTFARPAEFSAWAEPWRARLARETTSPEARAETMRLANPAFIPRNHRIEQAIEAAASHEDFAPFERLVRVLARPYDDQPEDSDLALPPRPEERVEHTFCGT